VLFRTDYTIYTLPIFDRCRVRVRVSFNVQIKCKIFCSLKKLLIITCNGTGNCINSCYKLDSRQYVAKACAFFYSRHLCFHMLVASVNSVNVHT